MSAMFKKIKAINQIDKDVVIGYTKNAQNILKPQQIPMAITYLCLLYFHQTDYFYKAGKMMKINDKGDILEVIQQCTTDNRSTCYGNLDIGFHSHFNKLILSWTFKIVQCPWLRKVLCIGIDSSKRRHYDSFFADYNDPLCQKTLFYAVTHQGCMYTVNGKKLKERKEMERLVAREWGQGDTIRMELNAEEKQLRYFVNGLDMGIVFDIPFRENTAYNLAVFAGDKDTKIQLLCFEKRLASPLLSDLF